MQTIGMHENPKICTNMHVKKREKQASEVGTGKSCFFFFLKYTFNC